MEIIIETRKETYTVYGQSIKCGTVFIAKLSLGSTIPREAFIKTTCGKMLRASNLQIFNDDIMFYEFEEMDSQLTLTPKD